MNTHLEAENWFKENPWFPKGDKIRSAQYLGIATAIRASTSLTGKEFFALVDKIWHESDIKDWISKYG